jgi:7SK snRNA methylphosphate capping enzyme
MINKEEDSKVTKKRNLEWINSCNIKKLKTFTMNCFVEEANLKQALLIPLIQLNTEFGLFLKRWPSLTKEKTFQQSIVYTLNTLCAKFETLKQMFNYVICDSSWLSCALHKKTLQKRFLRLLRFFFLPLTHFLLDVYGKKCNIDLIQMLLKSLDLKNLERNYKKTNQFIILNGLFWTWLPLLSCCFSKNSRVLKEKPIQYHFYTPLSSKNLVTRVPIDGSLVNGPVFFKKKKLFHYGNTFCSPKIQAEYIQKIPQNISAILSERLNSKKLCYFMKYDLFKNKKVLDIGCHKGETTFLIAMHCEPYHIVGQDMDAQLIEYCLQQVRDLKYHYYYQQKSTNRGVYAALSTHSLTSSPCVPLLSLQDLLQDQTISSTTFPFNISFVTKNCLNSLHDQQETFDTILALSITKWIHLQKGDTALKKAFQNIVQHLNLGRIFFMTLLKSSIVFAGGFFLLQPQSWESYKRNYTWMPHYKSKRHQIRFKPHHFDTYLQKELHLTRVALWQDNTNTSCNQTYFLYQKNRD